MTKDEVEYNSHNTVCIQKKIEIHRHGHFPQHRDCNMKQECAVIVFLNEEDLL